MLQRNIQNKATATVSGQLISNNLAVSLSYRIRTVSATGILGAAGPSTNLSLATNGMFYTTLVVDKGWYLTEILLNGVVYASAKFGIGDVFIIAGQSNAQGTGNDKDALPSNTNIPEWVVGTFEDKTCTKNFPASFTSMFSLNTSDQAKQYGRLGPSGNSVWAYATLGKLISDVNGGMPVAFFNAASGGTTITQWKQGSAGVEAKHPYTGVQICVGHKQGSMIPSDYYGQPYTTLKNALNYYGSLFGVRAVLWHQGEADADLSINASYKATSSADYQTKLQAVIAKSRADFGAPNLTWYVSKASISKFGPLNSMIRTGQGNVATGLPNLNGSETDYVSGSSGTTTASDGGDEYRSDSTHFYEGAGSIKGLTWLANKWFSTIGALVNPVAPGWVPQLTYSKNADWRTLTAQGGAVQYMWSKVGINGPAAPGGNASVYTTDEKYLGIRCYMKDANGNWHASSAINVGKYDNQRVAAYVEEETPESEEPGFDLNTYPNPFTAHFTIAFEVPENNSQVRLEIVNMQGEIVKTVVDNPHAKGKWQYEVQNLPDQSTEILFCRLKINEHSTIKKLLQLTK
ncbi:sialate O-acetylesterase [Dyadobacter sp. CY351]|uniref:sialate O-acetylesterase n=1 Tax=Dyadobacter sp. CY351 TaxID=2909337 RepID=UPI001F2C0776|nr:sialate O-acetylesterase [Dyadobacter sp. CY351]